MIRKFNVDSQTAEDLLQEVLLKIWKSLPKYEYRKNECTFRTWLCLVIKSTVSNHFRKRSTKNQSNTVSHDDFSTWVSISEPELNEIAELEWKSYISNMAWDNIIGEFAPRTIEIFEYSLDEENNALTAEKFQITEASVRVYKSRVKKVLLREISRLNEELGG